MIALANRICKARLFRRQEHPATAQVSGARCFVFW